MSLCSELNISVVCREALLKLCVSWFWSLTGSHLLYEALPREGGGKGGPLQEEESTASGVSVEHAVQGLPARRGERQALHEGQNVRQTL